MTYLTRAILVGVVITLFIWLATGFVAGTFDVMSFNGVARFTMLLIWCLLQVINAGAWACAYGDKEQENKYR